MKYRIEEFQKKGKRGYRTITQRCVEAPQNRETSGKRGYIRGRGVMRQGVYTYKPITEEFRKVYYDYRLGITPLRLHEMNRYREKARAFKRSRKVKAEVLSKGVLPGDEYDYEILMNRVKAKLELELRIYCHSTRKLKGVYKYPYQPKGMLLETGGPLRIRIEIIRVYNH